MIEVDQYIFILIFIYKRNNNTNSAVYVRVCRGIVYFQVYLKTHRLLQMHINKIKTKNYESD